MLVGKRKAQFVFSCADEDTRQYAVNLIIEIFVRLIDVEERRVARVLGLRGALEGCLHDLRYAKATDDFGCFGLETSSGRGNQNNFAPIHRSFEVDGIFLMREHATE